MSDDVYTHCAICDAFSTKKCARCKAVSYCSPLCQAEDWSAHKKICSDLQLELTLDRTAAVIENAYLAFRKNTWDTTVLKVEDTENTLVIYEATTLDTQQGFVDFPDGIVSDNNKRLDIDIEEIGVRFKTVPGKVIAINTVKGTSLANWPGYSHTIMRVKSRKSGKQWVLDITGAQYGFTKVVHEWSAYEETFVDKVVAVYRFGAHQHIFAEMAGVPGLSTLNYRLMGKAATVLDEAVVSWETQNQPISTLRNLNSIDFVSKKASFLDHIDEAVRRFVSTNDFTAIISKAKADDSSLMQQIAKANLDQLLNEANLLRYPGGKPTMMDRLREEFGPEYTYREGDEYCLPIDELLEFTKEDIGNRGITYFEPDTDGK
ncbi:hypothetical protein E8E13_004616 [Curvularia kusanoi]|uniref:MYND-type domain-containing protein n=1 Tax=Curvularia kusanoi TaxID=90978 RepID=A0A9P4TQ48_CURKU|nr:hypothetical protein E8E13_004616 [Curvularia kusanoi]